MTRELYTRLRAMERELLRQLSKIAPTKVSRDEKKNDADVTKKTKSNKIVVFFLCSGVTGSTIKIDSNGDSEGNFSVVALKPYKMTVRENFSCHVNMVPVAYFQQGENFPVSESSLLFLSNKCNQFKW